MCLEPKVSEVNQSISDIDCSIARTEKLVTDLINRLSDVLHIVNDEAKKEKPGTPAYFCALANKIQNRNVRIDVLNYELQKTIDNLCL